MSTNIDINSIIQRVLQERQGLIPPGSVTVEEIRAALHAQREAFSKTAQTNKPPKPQTRKAQETIIVPEDPDDILG